jgi:hypothetical protein
MLICPLVNVKLKAKVRDSVEDLGSSMTGRSFTRSAVAGIAGPGFVHDPLGGISMKSWSGLPDSSASW